MKFRASLIFFILFLCSLHFVQAENDSSYLEPDIPNCFHIAPSTTNIHYINISQQITSVSFMLNWRSDASLLELTLRPPDGSITGQKNATMPGLVRENGKNSQSYSISTPIPGNWTLEVISGNLTKEGEDYCLTAKPGETKVGAPAGAYARFNGIMRNFLSDKRKSDRIPGDIALKVGVDVMKAGNYSLQASIEDLREAKELSLSSKAHLNLGSDAITIYITYPCSSGPYRVKDLILTNESGTEIDALFANYIIKKYPEVEPDDTSARLTGRLSDYGSDINNDGLYEYLTIDVGVGIQEPDNYSLLGSLYDVNDKYVIWSMSTANLSAGDHIMHMDFDGKSIELQKVSGPYRLKELTLLAGSREENTTVQDVRIEPYSTKPYNYTQFMDPIWPEQILSGSGYGEILLTIIVKSVIPVFQGRYSYDIVGVSMPPISSNWTWSASKEASGWRGYAYDLPGVHMPALPNNFTVRASGVKNLGVGVRQDPNKDRINYTRMWISSQAKANKDGEATLENEMISPGRYQFKIFGDAAENVSQVFLEMEVVKKLVINGRFQLALNTSGFPSGNYSINARAINGSFKFDEINLTGPSFGF